MDTPFSWLPPDMQGSAMISIAIASLAMAKILSTVGAGLTLKNEGIAFGIVNLEVSWSRERAEAIVTAWKNNGVVGKAVQQTQLDFVFLLIYPAALSLACVMTAGGGDGFMAAAGIAMSWIVLLCAPFDALENLMLLRMLKGSFEPNIPRLTAISASLKFLIILLTLLYLLVMVFMK
ncbi:MAG: hypothetical protein HGA77_10795 [Chlorobiaceae bacterium]|nr:hypothetical protein [Chlorobiaceae bacterium]